MISNLFTQLKGAVRYRVSPILKVNTKDIEEINEIFENSRQYLDSSDL